MTSDPPTDDRAAESLGGDSISSDGERAYRELSTAAIASVAVGLISPVVLFGGVLAVVPLAAVALGLLALRWIAGDPRGRSGRVLALIGANLGVAVLAMAGVKAVASPLLLKQQAQACAQAWFDRLRADDLEAAAALSRLPAAKPSETKPPAITEAWPVVEEIRGLEGWSGVRLEETLSCASLAAGAWQVDQRYRLIGAEEPLREVVLRLVRMPAGPLVAARWRIAEVAVPEPQAGPPAAGR